MSDFKVACATSNMASFFKKWFGEDMIVFDKPENASKVDLLILTGGEDVNPKLYGEAPNGAVGWNDDRDTIEWNILKNVRFMDSLHKTDTKILGVCRGLQLINVFFGGTLYQDLLSDLGRDHDSIHKIKHVKPNPLSWMQHANSLHHEAVKTIGHRGNLLSVEPETGVVEAASYGNSVLGVQYHPELFGDVTGTRFFSVIEKWVKGEVQFEAPDPSPKDKANYYANYFASLDANTDLTIDTDTE